MERERERETRRPRDEYEDVGGPNKKRREGQSQKNPPSRTIQQATPSPLRLTANDEIVDGDYVGFDWRKRKMRGQPVLSPVANQGPWSVCWVFSILDTIETTHKIQTEKEIHLSKQQLIDFVWPKKNYETNRGYSAESTLDFIKDNGITYEDDYPYLSFRQDISDSETTKFKNLFHIKGYGKVEDMAVISQILKDRPLIICAKFDMIFFHHKGWSIYIPEADAKLTHPHGLVLVGEGTEINDGAHSNYWIVKNSYGDIWGEKGFGRIIKDNNNLKIKAWYPILCNDKSSLG